MLPVILPGRPPEPRPEPPEPPEPPARSPPEPERSGTPGRDPSREIDSPLVAWPRSNPPAPRRAPAPERSAPPAPEPLPGIRALTAAPELPFEPAGLVARRPAASARAVVDPPLAPSAGTVTGTGDEGAPTWGQPLKDTIALATRNSNPAHASRHPVVPRPARYARDVWAPAARRPDRPSSDLRRTPASSPAAPFERVIRATPIVCIGATRFRELYAGFRPRTAV